MLSEFDFAIVGFGSFGRCHCARGATIFYWRRHQFAATKPNRFMAILFKASQGTDDSTLSELLNQFGRLPSVANRIGQRWARGLPSIQDGRKGSMNSAAVSQAAPVSENSP
jgi:hypothetical protein